MNRLPVQVTALLIREVRNDCDSTTGPEWGNWAGMRIRKKQTAWGLLLAFIVWEGVGQPIWNLNVERVAEQSKIDGTLAGLAPMSALQAIADYLPSSFASGFVVGGLIFAYWDTLIAKWNLWRGGGPQSELRAWIGNMWPHFDPAKRQIEIWVSIINVGLDTFTVRRAEGSVRIKAAGGRSYLLSSPHIVNLTEEPFERGFYSHLAIRFDVQPSFWDYYPDLFTWSTPKTSVDLSSLSIVIVSEGGTAKNVTGWHSMRLTSGADQVRSSETMPMFESEEERSEFIASMQALAGAFQPKVGPH